jgi:hypothetical protein
MPGYKNHCPGAFSPFAIPISSPMAAEAEHSAAAQSCRGDPSPLHLRSCLSVRFIENTLIDLEVASPSFQRYFSHAKHQKIGGVGLQDCANCVFLYLPLKTSLKGWHTQWFYCENHEPSIPPFVGQFPEFEGSCTIEPAAAKMPEVLTLAKKVSKLK